MKMRIKKLSSKDSSTLLVKFMELKWINYCTRINNYDILWKYHTAKKLGDKSFLCGKKQIWHWLFITMWRKKLIKSEMFAVKHNNVTNKTLQTNLWNENTCFNYNPIPIIF